ncbi:hypothetical protein [Kitasatospora sp. DSM 101779]|uniref:hypothetical protein n=1 Tax=Kitasatospora sp. DSM 101779 TaxID=2853165 RepID=UPI0021D940E8|nr:hypothetical protein [Kitasatospora sp. DSM 101779]MCU7827251.1 hypothetical protein [Kitasatospora sp. DSM 101779]
MPGSVLGPGTAVVGGDHDLGEQSPSPRWGFSTPSWSPNNPAQRNRFDRIGDLTYQHWAFSPYRFGYDTESICRNYTGTIPLLATTLDRLQRHGLTNGPTWWRYGHRTWQPFHDALANPDGYAAHLERRWAQEAEERRRETERKEAEQRREAARQQAQQREAATQAVERDERPDLDRI